MPSRCSTPCTIASRRSTACAAQEPSLHPGHLAAVHLVIVTEKVQKPMQGQNPELRAERMPQRATLPRGHAARNHNLTEVRAEG